MQTSFNTEDASLCFFFKRLVALAEDVSRKRQNNITQNSNLLKKNETMYLQSLYDYTSFLLVVEYHVQKVGVEPNKIAKCIPSNAVKSK